MRMHSTTVKKVSYIDVTNVKCKLLYVIFLILILVLSAIAC